MPLVTTTATDTLSAADFAMGGSSGLLQAVPVFPLSLAATQDLLDWANSFPSDSVTTLQSAILSGAATIQLTAGTGQYLRATENFEVSIDDEIIFVKSRSGDVLSGCIRGVESTAPAFHDIGSVAALLITAKAHNQLAAEIVAIEQYLAGPKQVSVTSPNNGNFSVPHGLTRAPRRVSAVRMTSSGLIWFQTASFDAVNLNLAASDTGLTGVVEVWL
jgi:hypothetical protein